MNNHSIDNEKIIEQGEDALTIEYTIPESSDFFDGHFPEYKLLPAVAQFETVTRFCKKYFGTKRHVPAIRRIKFSAPIRPDTTVKLELKLNRTKNSVAYTISNAKNLETVYSSGNFSVEF